MRPEEPARTRAGGGRSVGARSSEWERRIWRQHVVGGERLTMLFEWWLCTRVMRWHGRRTRRRAQHHMRRCEMAHAAGHAVREYLMCGVCTPRGRAPWPSEAYGLRIIRGPPCITHTRVAPSRTICRGRGVHSSWGGDPPDNCSDYASAMRGLRGAPSQIMVLSSGLLSETLWGVRRILDSCGFRISLARYHVDVADDRLSPPRCP